MNKLSKLNDDVLKLDALFWWLWIYVNVNTHIILYIMSLLNLFVSE